MLDLSFAFCFGFLTTFIVNSRKAECVSCIWLSLFGNQVKLFFVIFIYIYLYVGVVFVNLITIFTYRLAHMCVMTTASI